MILRVVLLGWLASAVVASAAAAAGTYQASADQQIQSQLEHRLQEHQIYGVTISVRDRAVTLSGMVTLLWAKNAAIDLARNVRGVSDVVSLLTVARGESDRAIEATLAAKLRRYLFFTVFDDVNVNVTDGIATLTGDVTEPCKAEAMAELAARIAGVQAVINRIEPLPVSPLDDQIRYSTAVRIYNEPLFWNYAMLANPPIHIIVKHGRVTLTGVVISEVERRKAEQIAREIFGVLNVDNKLRRDQ